MNGIFGGSGLGVLGGGAFGEVFTDRADYDAARADYEAALAEEEKRGMEMNAWWDATQAAEESNEQKTATHASQVEKYKSCVESRERKLRECDVRKRQAQDGYAQQMDEWLRWAATRLRRIQERMAERNAYSTGSDPFPPPYSAAGTALAMRLIQMKVSKETQAYAKSRCRQQYPALRGLGAVAPPPVEYQRLIKSGLSPCEISVIGTGRVVPQPKAPSGVTCKLPHCGPAPRPPKLEPLPLKPEWDVELVIPEEPEWAGVDDPGFSTTTSDGGDGGFDDELEESIVVGEDDDSSGGMSSGLILLLVAAGLGGAAYMYSRRKKP